MYFQLIQATHSEPFRLNVAQITTNSIKNGFEIFFISTRRVRAVLARARSRLTELISSCPIVTVDDQHQVVQDANNARVILVLFSKNDKLFFQRLYTCLCIVALFLGCL